MMSEQSKKRVLSAIQPTADMHIGNYFGAVQNWVRLQEECDCIYGVVDLHAMTVAYDPSELAASTRLMFTSLIACGLDPERSTLFVQSLVPEHTELCWVLTTLTSLGDLSRMTQFKEKSGYLEGAASEAQPGDEFISAGLLFYPVLQAADILSYKPQFVPVGQDQKQHLELTRGLARRFNSRFQEDFFPEPQPLFTPTPKIMSFADPTRKMSKSLGPKHYVGLFEDPDSISKKVRSAVTDSGDVPEGEMSPGVENLLGILTACGHTDAADRMAEQYHEESLRYSDLKNSVADALIELTSGFRDRRDQVSGSPEQVESLIRESSAQAREQAARTLSEVRQVVGLG